MTCTRVRSIPMWLVMSGSNWHGGRKRFLGNLLAGPDGTPRPFGECDGATVAVTALAAADAWCVRVHQVPLNADAVRVAAAWRDAAATGATGPPLPVVRGVTGRS